MKATVLDLRKRMREVLQALARKESVTILYRGKVKGVIQPSDSPENRGSVADHPAFGIWKDREDLDDVDRHVRQLRKARGRAL